LSEIDVHVDVSPDDAVDTVAVRVEALGIRRIRGADAAPITMRDDASSALDLLEARIGVACLNGGCCVGTCITQSIGVLDLTRSTAIRESPNDERDENKCAFHWPPPI
jgi:hypothetical protein